RGAAVDFATRAPWMAIFPGLAITLTVLAVNVLGDSLRDALDPRLRT
ncbi:MAG: ABC transporter permease, partial [bacterium]